MDFNRLWNSVKRMKLKSMLTMIVLVTSPCSHMEITAAFTVISPIYSSHQSKNRFHSSKSFVFNGSSSDNATLNNGVLQVLTDHNREVLLKPSSDPKRPVLVDAFAPWCGPCKLLDKVLKKAQPRYIHKVDFCRWNVNDVENTVKLKAHFLELGYTLKKLPSLIVFREGDPIAIRPGFVNEFQLDDWLERTLPDVLSRTFDEDGVKIVSMSMGSTRMDDEQTLLFEKIKETKDGSISKAEETRNRKLSSDKQEFKAKVTVRADNYISTPIELKSRLLIERLRIAPKE